jgi:hypothetical protein
MRKHLDDNIRDAIFEMCLQLQAGLNDFEYRQQMYGQLDRVERAANSLLRTLKNTSVSHTEARREAITTCAEILEAVRGDRVEQPIDLCANIIKKEQKK